MSSGRPGKSLLEDPVWIELLERYVAGETAAVLALEYKVSVWTIAWQARNRGYRKMDRPGAVYRWRQAPPITPAPDPVEARGFDFDPGDLEGSEARALAKAVVAAREGRVPDFLALTQSVRATRRLKGGAGAGPLHHPSDGPPPHQDGEETTGPALDLRDSQKPPEGDWSTWLFLGGRGAGKTLAGAMWLSDMAEALGPGGRLALIGPTLHDVREVMIDGASGIVGLPRWAGGARPAFEPSRRRLTFPNGAMAYAFSAEDPDSLRGPQFGAAWADEFCAWPRTRGGPGETLALLRMGLRLPGPVRASESLLGRGQKAPPSRPDAAWAPPRLLVTTTPKPIATLRALRAEAGCVETHAATRDNAANLSAGFVEGLERLYGGTRKAAQELEGRVVEAEGALFTSEMLAKAREHPAGGYRPLGYLSPRTPEDASPADTVKFDRIVVAVDPTTTAAGNACGIVVAGRCGERVHVLADRSVAGLGPDGWARRAVRAAEEFGAVALVAEVNQGGEMVQAVLKTAGCSVRVRPVRATRGKRVRAEPVAALYEQGRVTHAPGLGALEEELMAFGGEDEGAWDLDRADALVWAVTDLLIDRAGAREGPSIRVLDWGMRSSGLLGRAW